MRGKAHDRDGDLDLVVACPDVPYNGVWFFENPGGPMPLPVFRPGVRISAATSNLQVSYVAGEPVVLSPGKAWPEFRGRGQDGPGVELPAPAKMPVPYTRTRANQWRLADLDADGAADLVVGVEYWDDYGWDNAFDSAGRWTRGPLHGLVFWLRNTGTTAAPQYAEPQQLTAGGQPVDTFGMPSPSFADFDGDGDLDLLCGEFVNGFTWFQNVGTKQALRLAPGRRLMLGDQPLTTDLCMITPTAIDWDADGDPDLICGDEDGRVAFLEHTGRVVDGLPQLAAPRYFRQQAANLKFGALATPCAADWDEDGDQDLICGNTAGYIAFIENLDGGDPPRWAEPRLLTAGGQTIRWQAGPNGSIQGPAEARWGYTTQTVADWDGDGRLDIVANSIWGKVVWYRNVGAKGRPELAAAQPVTVAWPPGHPVPRPAWTWWSPAPGELATQWRTTPVAVDWTRDGLCDLVMLDHEGYLALFRRERRGDALVLLPGERRFVTRNGLALEPLRLNNKPAGGSGRRKLCLADWDGDGDLDLLLNARNVELWVNQGEVEGRTVLVLQGNLATDRLAGHDTSPTTVDWNRDGRPDLLVGAEDGHFYHLPNRGPLAWQTPDGSVTVSGFGFGLETLRTGGTAYSNRDYVWEGVPAALTGSRFTQTAGGGAATVALTAHREVTLRVATATAQPPADLAGWTLEPDLGFRYSDGGHTLMSVFSRRFVAGESVVLRQLNWSGLLLLLPAGDVR